jgi:hypothetical protein
MNRSRSRQSGRRTVAAFVVAISVTMSVSFVDALPSTVASASVHSSAHRCGAPSSASKEPSGVLPLEPYTFAGWVRVYCTDFPGHKLPKGWEKFSGVPKGDPVSRWAPSHVTVRDGMLVLRTWRDPRYGRKWTSGGVCQCGRPALYGAFYVRSRLTGGGASGVELLWPKNNVWPPEVDFFESWQQGNRNTYTDHFSVADHITQGWLNANLMKWHTWGVIWRPHEIQFVVDWGTSSWTIWGTIRSTSAVPQVPMTLDIDQQTWCSILPACPTQASSLLVDWVAEFEPGRAS